MPNGRAQAIGAPLGVNGKPTILRKNDVQRYLLIIVLYVLTMMSKSDQIQRTLVLVHSTLMLGQHLQYREEVAGAAKARLERKIVTITLHHQRTLTILLSIARVRILLLRFRVRSLLARCSL